MPADATAILISVSAALTTRYGLPVATAKRPVGNGRPPLGGVPADLDLKGGAFVVSAQDPESVDDDGTFEEVSVRYSVTVDYLKPSHAMTGGGEGPLFAEDADVRDKRAGVRALLYAPRATGVADVANVSWRARPAYEVSGAGGAPVLVSAQTVTYEAFEARPA